MLIFLKFPIFDLKSWISDLLLKSQIHPMTFHVNPDLFINSRVFHFVAFKAIFAFGTKIPILELFHINTTCTFQRFPFATLC